LEGVDRAPELLLPYLFSCGRLLMAEFSAPLAWLTDADVRALWSTGALDALQMLVLKDTDCVGANLGSDSVQFILGKYFLHSIFLKK